MPKRRFQHATLFILCLLLLLERGCILWFRSEQRQYALNRQLIAALVRDDANEALALVNEGASPNTPYKPAPTPTITQLMKQFFHCAASGNGGPTALLIACGAPFNKFRFVDIGGANINRSPEISWFVLEDERVEARKNCTDNAQLMLAMLSHRAAVNVKGDNGATPLMWAVMSNRSKTIDILLKRGADANAQDKNGETPLIIAVRFPPALRLLLQHGVNVNAKDRDGNTALSEAVRQDMDIDVVRQLLAYGADPNLADTGGNTSLKFAQYNNRPDLVALLKQAGARK